MDRIIGTPASTDEAEGASHESVRTGRGQTLAATNSAAGGSNSNDSKSVLLSSKSSEEISDDDSYNADFKVPAKTLEWYGFFHYFGSIEKVCEKSFQK